MQKKQILAGVTLGLLFAVSKAAGGAVVCGEICTESADCGDSCGVCLSGICQHRCMAAASPLQCMEIVNTANSAQCNEACQTSYDCDQTTSCNLCLDNTCQHRCLVNPLDVACLENEVKIETYEENTVVSNSCATSADCLDSYNWFCADGVCEHRCLENGVCSREAYFNLIENEVSSNGAV